MSAFDGYGNVDSDWDIEADHEPAQAHHDPEITELQWLEYHRSKNKARNEAAGVGAVGIAPDGTGGNFQSVYHCPQLYNLRAVTRNSGGPKQAAIAKLEELEREEEERFRLEKQLFEERQRAKQKKMKNNDMLESKLGAVGQAARQQAKKEVDDLVEKKREEIWARGKGGLADEKEAEKKQQDDFMAAQRAYGDVNSKPKMGKVDLGDERRGQYGGTERYCSLTMQYAPEKQWCKTRLTKKEMEIREFLTKQRKTIHLSEKERLVPPKDRVPSSKREKSYMSQVTALDYPDEYRVMRRKMDFKASVKTQFGRGAVGEIFGEPEQRMPRVDKTTIKEAVADYEQKLEMEKMNKKKKKRGPKVQTGRRNSVVIAAEFVSNQVEAHRINQIGEAHNGVFADDPRSRALRSLRATVEAAEIDYELKKKNTFKNRMQDRAMWWKETLLGKPHKQIAMDGFTPEIFFDACEVGEIETVKACRIAGLPTTCRNEDGRTGVHLATINGHLEIIDILMMHKLGDRHESAINFVDKDVTRRYTALHEAVHLGNIDAVRCLLRHGANIDAKEGLLHRTPLMTALVHRREEIARLLLGKHADVFGKDENGNTVLHLAVDAKCTKKTVVVLLSCGAIVHVENKDGQEPGDIAIRRGRRAVGDLLKKYRRAANIGDVMKYEDANIDASCLEEIGYKPPPQLDEAPQGIGDALSAPNASRMRLKPIDSPSARRPTLDDI